MATTSFPVNHPLAVKVWSKKLFVEALKETYFSRFMGEGTDSLCQVKPELTKGAGDKITYGLRMQLSGTGVQGDQTLEGNEEALVTYSDSILIDQVRHAVRSAGKMTEQRVPFSIREEARQGLQDWWANRLDTAFFNHLCNDTTITDTLYTGNNAIAAIDTTHRMLSHLDDTSPATDELSISTTDTFDLAFIDAAVEKAKTLSTMVRPLKVGGADMYVCFLHPYQVYNLRTATATGQWLDIQKAALGGGDVSNNPIFTGALGVYNNVVLHESTRITPAITNAGAYKANTRRAVLCGAQAMTFAYGMANSGGEMTWVEEKFDYNNQLGVSSGMIFGMKAVRFNSADFGKIMIPTYAAAHG